MERYYRLQRKRAKDRAYFRKQKIYGVLVALFGLVCVAFGEGWQWANFRFMGDVIVLFGLYTAITQNRLLSE